MKRILSLLLATSSIFSMELDLVKSDMKKDHHIKQIFVPNHLGLLELYHGKNGFYVRQDDKKYEVKKYFTDPIIRDVTKKQLTSFLKGGYLSLNKMNDGEFSLKAKGRINGGGPLFGKFMYWLTKSACYGGLAVAVGTSVVSTGGAIAGSLVSGAGTKSAGAGTIIAVAGSTASTAVIGLGSMNTAGAVIYTTAGTVVASSPLAVGFGAGGVVAAAGAKTVVGAAITKAAVTTTGAVLSTGTSTGGIIVGIEAVSLAVGTFFGMLPTP